MQLGSNEDSTSISKSNKLHSCQSFQPATLTIGNSPLPLTPSIINNLPLSLSANVTTPNNVSPQFSKPPEKTTEQPKADLPPTPPQSHGLLSSTTTSHNGAKLSSLHSTHSPCTNVSSILARSGLVQSCTDVHIASEPTGCHSTHQPSEGLSPDCGGGDATGHGDIRALSLVNDARSKPCTISVTTSSLSSLGADPSSSQCHTNGSLSTSNSQCSLDSTLLGNSTTYPTVEARNPTSPTTTNSFSFSGQSQSTRTRIARGEFAGRIRRSHRLQQRDQTSLCMHEWNKGLRAEGGIRKKDIHKVPGKSHINLIQAKANNQSGSGQICHVIPPNIEAPTGST